MASYSPKALDFYIALEHAVPVLGNAQDGHD